MANKGSFEQAAFRASVVSPDGRPLDFRSVIELVGSGRIGVDPADPRARLTETGSLLAARGGSAYVRSPPFEAGVGAGSCLARCWARREAAALARSLPIEGRIGLVESPSIERLPYLSSDGRTLTPTGRPIEPAFLPYQDLAVGWISGGWRADVVVVAPGLVVIGIDDGASQYLAAPLWTVSRMVDLLHRAELEHLLASARLVPVLAQHWSPNGLTRSRRLGPRRGFLDRSRPGPP